MRITAFVLVACLIAPNAYSRWGSDLIEDGMTDERVGFVAEKGSSGSAVVIQRQEGAEMIVIFTLPDTERLPSRVTYRIDGGAVSTLPGFTRDGGVGVLGPDAEELIPKLLSGSKLRAQSHQTGIGAQSIKVFTFGLSGSTAAFAEACLWHPDYDELIS